VLLQTAKYDAENVPQKNENKYTGLDIIFGMTEKKIVKGVCALR
jgi:hypothetical protein